MGLRGLETLNALGRRRKGALELRSIVNEGDECSGGDCTKPVATEAQGAMSHREASYDRKVAWLLKIEDVQATTLCDVIATLYLRWKSADLFAMWDFESQCALALVLCATLLHFD